jgi:mannose-6-phosphate isomerase-like protein (cupin superfamily)
MPTAVAQFGPVVNDISGMGDTHELLGGLGSCRWKQLINGMHLNGPWNCVEYVVIPPGASCGKHTHLHTEEIYYILSGAAEMELNGDTVALTAGDLVTATIGTSHGTINRFDQDMEFLVVEVFPGDGGPPSPVRVRVGDSPPARARQRSGEADGATEHSADLSRLFTGPWKTFARIDVQPRGRLERDPVDDGDEVLFVARGSATLEFGSSVVEGDRGLCVGIPPGAPRAIANRSDNQTLEVLSTVVGLG